MSVRLVVSASLLALLAAGMWWTASLDGGDASAGSFAVFVVGPSGDVIANGTVAAQGTPFDVLVALAAAEGFEVNTERQAWAGGGCTATYVVGIAGQRESATGGWNYYTRPGTGGDWTWGPSGAACHRLAPGVQVEWCWVESDVCRHHVA